MPRLACFAVLVLSLACASPAQQESTAAPAAPQSAASSDPQATPQDAAPAAQAAPATAPGRVRVSSSVMSGLRIRGDAPVYPVEARTAKITGVVILEAVISKEGNIASLKVVKGPMIFQRAAMDAVKTWKYKPTTVNGKPVEVATTIDVDFKFTDRSR